MVSDEDTLPLVPLEPHCSQLFSSTSHIVRKGKLRVDSLPSQLGQRGHWCRLTSLDSLVAPGFSTIVRHCRRDCPPCWLGFHTGQCREDCPWWVSKENAARTKAVHLLILLSSQPIPRSASAGNVWSLGACQLAGEMRLEAVGPSAISGCDYMALILDLNHGSRRQKAHGSIGWCGSKGKACSWLLKEGQNLDTWRGR